MSTVLDISGSPVNRATARVILNRMTLSIEQPDTAEFTEINALLPGSFGAASATTLSVDNVPRFTGITVGSYPQGVGRRQVDVGYRAMGLSWMANQLAITGEDGGGKIVYNLPQTDLDYVAASSGLSVGQILTNLFNLHWPALTAIGVTAFSQEDLDLMTVVPPEPVVMTGRLWNAVIELLANWCNKYFAWIDASGLITVKDIYHFPHSTTIVLDGEPAILEQISRDHSECFSRVVCRGFDDIEGAYLSLSEKTLIPGWTADEQAHWSLKDFYQPKGASDLGNVLGQTSTTLTLQSDDTALTWDVNAISKINGEVWAYNPAAAGIEFIEQRRVTANTALTAGGTYTVTVDSPFNSVGYTRYSIRGQYATQSLVWRKYQIVPKFVAEHLVRRFSHSVPWNAVDGVAVTTMTPQANICQSASHKPPFVEVPATFDIVLFDGKTDGYIIFNEPVVKAFGTIANLVAGGAQTDGIPDDLKVLVPYSRGAIQAVYPPNDDGGNPVYGGTSYTVDGLERTLYREFPEWRDYRDTINYQRIAQETFDTVSNTVVEGSVIHLTKYLPALELGCTLNITGNGYLTGYEDIHAPIRSVTLDYQESSTPWATRFSFSNRLRPFCGDRLYAHPAYGQQAALSGGTNLFGLSVPAMIRMTQARAQSFQENYLTPPSGQDDLGITFEEPGQNRYRGKATEADRMQAAQHQERLARERAHQGPTEAEKMREDQRHNRNATEIEHRGDVMERHQEEQAAKGRQSNRRELERQEHLRGRDKPDDDQ